MYKVVANLCNWHCSIKVELVTMCLELLLTAEAIGASPVLPAYRLVWYCDVTIRKWGFPNSESLRD